jgi:hypothetical protein
MCGPLLGCFGYPDRHPMGTLRHAKGTQAASLSSSRTLSSLACLIVGVVLIYVTSGTASKYVSSARLLAIMVTNIVLGSPTPKCTGRAP